MKIHGQFVLDHQCYVDNSGDQSQPLTAGYFLVEESPNNNGGGHRVHAHKQCDDPAGILLNVEEKPSLKKAA